jgi:predicted small secreted protein
VKKLIYLLVACSIFLSGCNTLLALASLAATGFGIYQAVKSSK